MKSCLWHHCLDVATKIQIIKLLELKLFEVFQVFPELFSTSNPSIIGIIKTGLSVVSLWLIHKTMNAHILPSYCRDRPKTTSFSKKKC
jgi:hypothetical protein